MNHSKTSDRYQMLEAAFADIYEIDKILEIAYHHLGNPILVHDMDFKVLNFTKNIFTDDPIWNDYMEHGTISPEWMDFLERENFLDSAANTKKMTFLISDKLKYQRIYGKVFNADHLQIGCAILVECHKPRENDDPVLFELICDTLTTAYSKNPFFTAYGQAYFEKLMGQLIEGIAHEKRKYYIAHVESIYINLRTHLYLIAADLMPCELDCASLIEQLKCEQPSFKYAAYSHYLIILASTESHISNELGVLNSYFDRLGIYAGISSSFENLFALPKHFREAVTALHNGSKGKQHLFL